MLIVWVACWSARGWTWLYARHLFTNSHGRGCQWWQSNILAPISLIGVKIVSGHSIPYQIPHHTHDQIDYVTYRCLFLRLRCLHHLGRDRLERAAQRRLWVWLQRQLLADLKIYTLPPARPLREKEIASSCRLHTARSLGLSGQARWQGTNGWPFLPATRYEVAGLQMIFGHGKFLK